MEEKKPGQMFLPQKQFVVSVKIIKPIIKKYKYVQLMNQLLFFINAQNVDMNGEKVKNIKINILYYIYIYIFIIKYNLNIFIFKI